jgi:hypothetical protein
MKYFLYISQLFFLIIPLLYGCIREVKNIDLPAPKDSKLVVGCFISPEDSIIKATVTKSHSPYGFIDTGYPVVADAEVMISDGMISKQLIYSVDDSLYMLNSNLFPILSGKTYYLTVSAPGHQSVKASCSVPSEINTSLQLDIDSTVKSVSPIREVKYRLDINWQDLPGRSHYYRAFAEGSIIIHTETPPKTDTTYYSTSYPVTSDRDEDGGRFSFKNQTLDTYSSDLGYLKINELVVSLLTIDVNYFEYYQWMRNPGGGPFAEPKIVYSNIEGGHGVFGAYQKYTITVKF